MGLISNGSTIFDNGSMGSGFGGSLVFLSKQTASASSSISFTSGIDSTYKEYLFTFNNIHPASDNQNFEFNMSTDGGSNYEVIKTTTAHVAYHAENNSDAALEYAPGSDRAQSVDYQKLTDGYSGVGNDNDQSCSGYLHLFNPSSTTFVKHYFSRINISNNIDFSCDNYTAGYGNTTSAINALTFRVGYGNIDSGDICLYGIA